MLSLAIQSKRALFHVRRLAAYVAIVVAAAALTGCNGANQGFLRNGIGADLYSADIRRATADLEDYFGFICQQVGLRQDCNRLPPTGQQIWTQIVKQGMNDIDRRCDAYLEWLDDKKRSRGPLIMQIGSVGAATTGIMGVTGSATEAMTIVGLAFELLKQSIENYHSRLLLEVNTSTVNSIVLRGRQGFREDMQKRQIQINDRPDAELVLRSYLRICLPFAIESNINDFSTLGSLGIAADENNSINQTPIVGKPRPSKAGEAGKRTQGAGDQTPVGAVGDEGSIKVSNLKQFQSKLCLVQTGAFDNPTRDGIRVYQSLRNAAVTGELSSKDIADLLGKKTCNRNLYKNAYEELFLNDNLKVEKLQIRLNKHSEGGTIELDGILGKNTREKIARVRPTLGITGDGTTVADQFTDQFNLKLME